MEGEKIESEGAVKTGVLMDGAAEGCTRQRASGCCSEMDVL